MLVVDGLVQASGVVLAIVGLATHEELVLRDKSSSIRLTPIASSRFAGAGIAGSF
jgi:hypothetical protein